MNLNALVSTRGAEPLLKGFGPSLVEAMGWVSTCAIAAVDKGDEWCFQVYGIECLWIFFFRTPFRSVESVEENLGI